MPKVRKSQTKSRKQWTEEDMEKAMLEVTSGKSNVYAAKKYGMSEGILRHRIKMKQAGKVLVGSGRQTSLSQNEELNLSKCIGSMCRLGFSPTRAQIKDMVKDFVTAHQLKTPFKNDRPGKDWLKGFMDRNNLSLKKANMISAARKSATCNPFIINDFYDTIEKIIADKDLRPEQIWNCDDDPQKCKVISVRGETAYKVTCGAGRENITTLAVVNAAGRALDPLIIFPGKNLQSTWRGDNPLPEMFYGVSENGWMTTEVFYEWFVKFTLK